MLTCDSMGMVIDAVDNTDEPDDGLDCTTHTCVNGAVTPGNAMAGATCDDNDGSVCDGAGACVDCISASDCPMGANACQTRVCRMDNTCGIDNVADGTPVGTQTPGDCKVTQCDGAGDIETVADANDEPDDDGNQCTDDTCAGDMPDHPAVMDGISCDQNGGAVCGNGMCVECTEDGHCTDGALCVSNVCTITCMDGVKNGDEEGVDCGGASCAVCPSMMVIASGPSGTVGARFSPLGAGWTSATVTGLTTSDPISVTTTTAGTAIAVARQNNTGMMDDQAVLYSVWSMGTWSAFAEVATGATTRSIPDVSASGTEAQLVYQRPGDFKYMTASYDTMWSTPSPFIDMTTHLFGPVAASVAAIGSGDVIVAYIDGDAGNALFTRDRVSGVWGSAVEVSATGSVNFSVPPTIVASTAVTEALLVFVGNDGSIRFATRAAGVWSAPAVTHATASASTRVSVAALPGGDAALAFRGNDGNIYAQHYTGGVWAQPFQLNTDINGTITSVGLPAVADGLGLVDAEVVWLDDMGSLWHSRHVGGAWQTNPTTVSGAGLTSVGAATTR